MSYLMERFVQLMPEMPRALPDVMHHVCDLIYSHSALREIGVNVEDPTATLDDCYRLMQEAVRRYKLENGIAG